MKIDLPDLALVTLIGTSGAGKSTFGRRHFLPTEVVSSDQCRGFVADDENTLDANDEAFDLLHHLVGLRLKLGKLTVVDATNVQQEGRRSLLALARKYHVLPVAIVFNIPIPLCLERNKDRPDRNFGHHVIYNQYRQLRRSMHSLRKEGFKKVFVLHTPEEVEAVTVSRHKLRNNQKELHGPFDIIGDIHGCFTELKQLLTQLGYQVTRHRNRKKNYGYTVVPPVGRKAIFLGDLVDRGPASNEVLRLVMSMVEDDAALCVSGNHDQKLNRKLSGKNVHIRHGLAETLEQLATEPPEFIKTVKDFLDSLVSHYVLDEGKLVVAHAGLRKDMQGRESKAVRAFCQYGETTGEIDEFGLPVRFNWAAEYKGKAMVVYGHTPIPDPEWLNHTINLDTGCVFGGRLTALRYPEQQLVTVPAKKVYVEPIRPIIPMTTSSLSAQQTYDDLLHLEDVRGKRHLTTRLRARLTIREENAIAALEIMSRFAIHPKWLAYLPPTMSPTETSGLPEYLEHPAEALEYYRGHGVQKVICEEKHMGSRAVVIVGREEEAIQKAFGIKNEGIGKIYTRTGRNFFDDADLEQTLLRRLRTALDKSGLWEELKTDWALFDCELMPWSAKAQSLLENQYAAVGASAQAALPAVIKALEMTQKRGVEVNNLVESFKTKFKKASAFTNAYRQYCRPVNQPEDFTLAPFHILATEGQTHLDKDHRWHMETIHRICREDEVFLLATDYRIVDLHDPTQEQEATDWWIQLTEAGGEGMVVKPLDFIAHGEKDILQPAIKCRGKEYLRIIYGPEYDTPENIRILKKRGLGRKRSLALREFALGVEALERFVRKEPLRRVHECVFGVLALESEPVDPRL